MEQLTKEDQHERAANEVAHMLRATATMGAKPLTDINARLRQIGYLLVIVECDGLRSLELITAAAYTARCKARLREYEDA